MLRRYVQNGLLLIGVIGFALSALISLSAQAGDIRHAQAASAQEESPELPGLSTRAGERIRTVDIHVGKVGAGLAQSATSQDVTSVAADTRTKYAARNNLRIKGISAIGVGEWPRDPDHARAV